MSARPIHLLIPAAFAAFAYVGWMAGGDPMPPEQPPVVEEAPTKHSWRASRGPQRTAMPADVEARLASIRAAKTPVERMRATLELANALPVSEFERWYVGEWFDFHDGMDANLFFRITRARWLEADPSGLMDYSLRRNNENTGDVAAQWAGRDAKAARGYLDGVNDPAAFRRLASAMGEPLAKSDPALALSLVERLRNDGHGSDWPLEDLLGELAEVAPEQLARESEAWPDRLQRVVEMKLDQESLRHDFAGMIAALREDPDGKERLLRAIAQEEDLAKTLSDHAADLPQGWLAAAMAKNPYSFVKDDPEAWLNADFEELGFTDEQASQFRTVAVAQFASRSPAEALKLLDSAQLSSRDRQNLLTNALGEFARTDPKAAEAMVARLTEPAEIEHATAILDQVRDQAAGKAPTPAEWLSGVAQKGEAGMWQALKKIESWDHEQIAKLGQAFRALPDAERAVVATTLASERLSGDLPEIQGEALSYLLEKPVSAEGATPDAATWVPEACQLVATWGREDPVAAGRWVRSLPDGEARLWAAKNLAAHWADHEPAAAREWISTLPAGIRWEVVDYLDSGEAWKP